MRVGRDGAEGEQTLLLEWPVGAMDPVGYWLVTLARHTPLQDVVATAKGGSNKITENSSKKLASATSRGGVGEASITTSR